MLRPMLSITWLLLSAVACAGVSPPPATESPSSAATVANADPTPPGTAAEAESLLVDVRSLSPDIRVRMRYATSDNFMGEPLPGYEGNTALLRREAAAALARVQARLRPLGLGLLVFDAYRPVRATEAMMRWTERVGRQDLVRNGYIASRSRHNLGVAIDLTLVELATGAELDMGTPYDEFSEAAHTANATGPVADRRRILVDAMEREGFTNYAQEWWHFSYPVPDPLRFDVIVPAPTAPPAGTSAGMAGNEPEFVAVRPAGPASLPADAEDAQARLAASPRHGEWVMIAAGQDSVRAWIVYPERSTPAPVVIVIHEIFGLTHWIRAVTDQLAAEGFVAIAPDLLTTKNLPGAPADTPREAATAAIQTLQPADVQRWLDATARFGMSLPAATDHHGVVGFCWGGRASFAHAVHAPSLDAAVVYYGHSPDHAALASVQAPVLGLYAGNDARVNTTVPAADSAMRALGRTFEPHFFAGAGHGFLRQQTGQAGANLLATRAAWPLTVAWFRRHLEPR